MREDTVNNKNKGHLCYGHQGSRLRSCVVVTKVHILLSCRLTFIEYQSGVIVLKCSSLPIAIKYQILYQAFLF